MRCTQRSIWIVLFLALATLSCGDDGGAPPSDPGNPGDESRYLRAAIDGVPWEVPTLALEFGASHTAPGLYVIIGQPSGDYRLEFVLNNITGSGTYPLGVSGLCRGGTVTLSMSPATWRTPLSGAAGEITFSELSDSLMIGQFHFEADAIPGSATGKRAVTQGEFRMPITRVGVIGPVADNAWSEVRAEVAGRAWNAAHVATNLGSGTLSIVAFTDTRTLTLTLTEVQGPGVYPLSTTTPTRLMTAMGDGTDPLVCCWGLNGPATGSVTISSLTSTRIAGSFTASLEPAPGSAATGTLVIASGSFSNGLLVAP